jgi:hypothetical protein
MQNKLFKNRIFLFLMENLFFSQYGIMPFREFSNLLSHAHSKLFSQLFDGPRHFIPCHAGGFTYFPDAIIEQTYGFGGLFQQLNACFRINGYHQPVSQPLDTLIQIHCKIHHRVCLDHIAYDNPGIVESRHFFSPGQSYFSFGFFDSFQRLNFFTFRRHETSPRFVGFSHQ